MNRTALLLTIILVAGILVMAVGQDQTPTNGSAAVSPANGQLVSKTSPSQTLSFLVIGVLLGGTGQVARAIVGIKKEMDAASATTPAKSWNDWFNGKQLAVSLLLGAVAGLLASAAMLGAEIDRKFLLGCIAAGYAGSDFIEGFMTKYLP
jgi:hypothetical protein